MSEDTPVNTGVSWPDEMLARALVRKMQVKLHRWRDQRARHTESRMRGQPARPVREGGQRKRTESNPGTAPLADPTAARWRGPRAAPTRAGRKARRRLAASLPASAMLARRRRAEQCSPGPP
jgi:hypothetical protein